MASPRKTKDLFKEAKPQGEYKHGNSPNIEDSEEDLVAKCTNIYKGYYDSTFKFRRQWYLNDNFYDGRHFVWWRTSTGTIDRIQPPKGMSLRSIPKASRQVDSVENLATANRPKWTVYPDKDKMGMVTQEMQKIAMRSGQWLENKWDALNMDVKVHDLVHYGLKFPFSFIEIGYDKDIWACIWDAFDILFDPLVSDIDDSPVLIKNITKNYDDVMANPNYKNKDLLKPVSKLSADDMKDMRLVEKFGYQRGKDANVVDIREFKYKYTVPNEETGYGDTKIRIVTVGNDGVLLRDEKTDDDSFNMACFSPHAGALFQPAWIERLMSTNKSLDLIVSNIETFFHMMNRGYWIKHRNANVSRIVNESGAFIEWDVQEPKQAELSSIPSYVFAHMANLEKWMEEQSTSSVSVGRVPKGIKAYRAIESLKQSDFQSLGTTITRLEATLEKAAEIMLKFADKYYNTPQTVYRLQEEKPDYFDVIGGSFAGGAQPPVPNPFASAMGGGMEGMEGELPANVMQTGTQTPPKQQEPVPLKASYKVNVTIESGLAYTEEGKRDTMLELYSLGLVPAEKVLDMFKFSNVGDLIRSAQAEKQVSMIDTVDFQALTPELKKAVLQDLMQKNVSIPQAPMPKDTKQFRRKEAPKGESFPGSVK